MKQRSIKELVLFLLVLSTCLSFSFSSKKGCSGTYYISGKAYSSNKHLIKNGELLVKHGERKETFSTDSSGQFEIKIHWIMPCRSGATNDEFVLEKKRLNPGHIYIKHDKSELELNNPWNLYCDCFPESKEKITWKKDLHFN